MRIAPPSRSTRTRLAIRSMTASQWTRPSAPSPIPCSSPTIAVGRRPMASRRRRSCIRRKASITTSRWRSRSATPPAGSSAGRDKKALAQRRPWRSRRRLTIISRRWPPSPMRLMPSWAELMPASAWIAAAPPQSLWEATAIPLRDLTSLAGEASADVAIVGAGYTGLSAAHHLAASGLEPIVIEANTPGWGASGRNGGVITAKFRVTFPDIAAQHGKDVAVRMYQLANEAVDCVGEMVDGFAISAAGYERVGQVKAAHNDKALRHASKEAEWLKAELGDRSIRLLDARQVRQETGSASFVGGVQSDAAGGIHPLNFLRGIANGVADRGIRIHAGTPALRIRRETN